MSKFAQPHSIGRLDNFRAYVHWFLLALHPHDFWNKSTNEQIIFTYVWVVPLVTLLTWGIQVMVYFFRGFIFLWGFPLQAAAASLTAAFLLAICKALVIIEEKKPANFAHAKQLLGTLWILGT